MIVTGSLFEVVTL